MREAHEPCMMCHVKRSTQEALIITARFVVGAAVLEICLKSGQVGRSKDVPPQDTGSAERRGGNQGLLELCLAGLCFGSGQTSAS